METTETSDRFKTVFAVLLAFVTVMGAVVAWRAAVAADIANNTDFAGMAATLNAEETRALNTVTVYEHYKAYTAYLRYNELGYAIADALPEASGDEAFALERQMTDAWDLATDIQGNFFSSRYLTSDGNYDTRREFDESWADAAQQEDLYPDVHFDRADHFRNKSTVLVALLIVFGVSLLFYTLAQTFKRGIRFIMAGGGTLLLIAGTIALIVIETTM